MTNSIPNLVPKNTNIKFQGYRNPDPRIILMSNQDTINNYIRAGQNVIGPDYVLGEKSLAELLGDKLYSILNIILDGEVQEEGKKIREGLDLIA